MKTAETMCPVSTRAFSTHACLGHRGSARPPCQHVIGDQVLPGCSWGRQHRMGATAAFWPREDRPNGWQNWSGYVQKHHQAVPSTLRQRREPRRRQGRRYILHYRFYLWKPDMATGHHRNGGECSGQQHLPETRGPKRSVQTPQLYPRPEKTGTIEPHQTGQAWADWRRGPAARGGRGGQQQRERSPQHHGSRGTAVRHTGECIQNQKTNSRSCLRDLCTHRRAVPVSTQFLWYPSQKRPHYDCLNLFSGGGGG